jgi:hypothetical protein
LYIINENFVEKEAYVKIKNTERTEKNPVEKKA